MGKMQKDSKKASKKWIWILLAVIAVILAAAVVIFMKGRTEKEVFSVDGQPVYREEDQIIPERKNSREGRN